MSARCSPSPRRLEPAEPDARRSTTARHTSPWVITARFPRSAARPRGIGAPRARDPLVELRPASRPRAARSRARTMSTADLRVRPPAQLAEVPLAQLRPDPRAAHRSPRARARRSCARARSRSSQDRRDPEPSEPLAPGAPPARARAPRAARRGVCRTRAAFDGRLAVAHEQDRHRDRA